MSLPVQRSERTRLRMSPRRRDARVNAAKVECDDGTPQAGSRELDEERQELVPTEWHIPRPNIFYRVIRTGRRDANAQRRPIFMMLEIETECRNYRNYCLQYSSL